MPTKVLLIILVCVGLLVSRLIPVVDTHRSRSEELDFTFLPSPSYVNTISMGHQNTFVGLLWIKGMVYFGENLLENSSAPEIINLCNLVTKLDPQFMSAYAFLGTILNEENYQGTKHIDILKYGVEQNPENWQLALYYSMAVIDKFRDYSQAASIMKPFDGIPGIPKYIQNMHRTFQAQSSSDQAAILIYLEDVMRIKDYPILQQSRIKKIFRIIHPGLGFDSPEYESIQGLIADISTKKLPIEQGYRELIKKLNKF